MTTPQELSMLPGNRSPDHPAFDLARIADERRKRGYGLVRECMMWLCKSGNIGKLVYYEATDILPKANAEEVKTARREFITWLTGRVLGRRVTVPSETIIDLLHEPAS